MAMPRIKLINGPKRNIITIALAGHIPLNCFLFMADILVVSNMFPNSFLQDDRAANGTRFSRAAKRSGAASAGSAG
jgi:hypothetical protein